VTDEVQQPEGRVPERLGDRLLQGVGKPEAVDVGKGLGLIDLILIDIAAVRRRVVDPRVGESHGVGVPGHGRGQQATGDGKRRRQGRRHSRPCPVRRPFAVDARRRAPPEEVTSRLLDDPSVAGGPTVSHDIDCHWGFTPTQAARGYRLEEAGRIGAGKHRRRAAGPQPEPLEVGEAVAVHGGGPVRRAVGRRRRCINLGGHAQRVRLAGEGGNREEDRHSGRGSWVDWLTPSQSGEARGEQPGPAGRAWQRLLRAATPEVVEAEIGALLRGGQRPRGNGLQ
jgi:hypothetical protein